MAAEANKVHIERTPGVLSGRPRIAGRRIAVRDIVVWHERLGQSADEIADAHELSLAQVYGALAYYFDHRAEIDRDIADSETFVEAMRQATPSKVGAKVERPP